MNDEHAWDNNDIGSFISLDLSKMSVWLQIQYLCGMKEEKGIGIACISGVRDPQRLASLQDQLTAIGIKYSQNFLHQTDLLIVSSVLKEKYKIWRYLKKRIPCVRVDWVQDCFEEKKIVPIANYQIKSPLHESKVGVCGFSTETSSQIRGIIQSLGGFAIVMDTEDARNQMRRNELKVSEEIEVIVMERNFYTRACMRMTQINVPCVGLEWLSECQKKKVSKYPLDFSYNYYDLKSSTRERELSKLGKKMQEKISEPFLQTPIGSFINSGSDDKRVINRKVSSALFRDCIVFLHPDLLKPDLVELLRKLICLEEGTYLQFLTPALTHIVVEKIQENEYLDLLKYGDSISIVRVEWVIDSLLFDARMEEVDYQIRYYYERRRLQIEKEKMMLAKNVQKGSMSEISISTAMNQNELTPHKNDKNQKNEKNQKNQRSQKKSVSISLSAIPEMTIIKRKVEYKSEILKGFYFYIPSKIKREREIKSIILTIRENAGVTYYQPKVGVCMFCVLLDTHDLTEIFKEVSEGYEGQLQPISPRWISYCVKKGVLIDFHEENYFIFKPFPFKTPIFQFYSLKIEVVGVKDSLWLRIKELISELGSRKMSLNVCEITHCICGNDMDERAQRRVKDIQEGNRRAKFIKLSWIFACMKKGFIQPECPEYQLTFKDQDQSAPKT